MVLVNELTTIARQHVKTELSRLSNEIGFVDKIDTTIDDMVGAIVEGVFTKIQPDIIQHTNLPEDLEMVKSLIFNAIYKSIDPSQLTGISDIVNRRPGEIVGQFIGSSKSSNLISSISNRVGGLNSLGISRISRGSFGSVDTIPGEVYDASDRIYNKIFNVVGLILTINPGLVPQLGAGSTSNFSEKASAVSSSLTRFSELSQSISDNVVAIDSSYYTIDHFGKTIISQSHLEDADKKMVNVRSKLLFAGAFDEFRYGLAKQDVRDAADALSSYGNSNNKINEILGAVDELDYLMTDIEDNYFILDSHLSSLKDYMNEFKSQFSSQSSITGLLDNIQSEIRSIISSMDAVIAKNQISIMPYHERRWWLELMSLVEQMGMVPSQVGDYYTSDPDGYIADYNTNVALPLQSINLSDIGLLSSQLKQLKYWVNKKLDANIIVTPIVNLVSQIISDNSSRLSDISNASSIASGYSVPISTDVINLVGLLKDTGMDRASDFLVQGRWKDFFSMDSSNATYLGNMGLVIKDSISSAPSNITLDGLAALTDAYTEIRNQKRARDLLATTFSTFKDLALSFKVNYEIPEVQKLNSDVERYTSEII